MENLNNETIYKVLLNDEEQHALWPNHLSIPHGWKEAGYVGDKESCMSFVNQVWTDITPLSSRIS